MLQLIQNYKTGELKIEDVPPPALHSGGVLVRNAYSLISARTERSSVSTAQANLIVKARKCPDLVKQVIDNVKREGVIATYKKVKSRLDDIKPYNIFSSVFSEKEIRTLFSRFTSIEIKPHYLNERHLPILKSLLSKKIKKKIANRYAWHMWIKAIK